LASVLAGALTELLALVLGGAGLVAGLAAGFAAGLVSAATIVGVAFLLTAMGYLVAAAGQASYPAGQLCLRQHAQRRRQ